MQCFVSTKRDLLYPMWERLKREYWLDPNLMYTVSEALGTYLYIRWRMDRYGGHADLHIYMEDLIEYGALHDVPYRILSECWDFIYKELTPTLRSIKLTDDQVFGSVSVRLGNERDLLGVVVGIRAGS